MDPRLGDQWDEGVDTSSCEYTLESGLAIKIVGEEPGGTRMQKSGSSMEQWAGISPPYEEHTVAASEAEASLRRLQAGSTSTSTDRRTRNVHRRSFTPSGLQTQVISERGESDSSDMAVSLNLLAGVPPQDCAMPSTNVSGGFTTTPDIRMPHFGTPQITVTADMDVAEEKRRVDVAEIDGSGSYKSNGTVGEYAYSKSLRLTESTVSPSGDSGGQRWPTHRVDAATTDKMRYTEAVLTSISPDRRPSVACKSSPLSERRYETSELGMRCSRSTSRLLSDIAHAGIFGFALEDDLAMKQSISMPNSFGNHGGSEPPLLPPAHINLRTHKAEDIEIENARKKKEYLNVLEYLHKKAIEKEGEARETYISTTYEFHNAEACFLEAERKLKLQKTRMEGSLKVLHACCENADIINRTLSQWRSKG